MKFALEMDLGGEPIEKVFASKIRRYAFIREENALSIDRVLTVTTSVRRAAI